MPVKTIAGRPNRQTLAVRGWVRRNEIPEIGDTPVQRGIFFPHTPEEFHQLTGPQVCDICDFYGESFDILRRDSLQVRQQKLLAAFSL